MRLMCLAAAIAAAVSLSACPHGSSDTARKPETGLQAGGRLYGEHCATCHGKDGQGTDKAPPLIGPTAMPAYPPPTAKKRITRFRTAKDVATFITHNMPADDPGSLNSAEYLEILGYMLTANGVDLRGRDLDMNTLDQAPVHGEQP